jgi:hypothetical protein
MSFFETEVWGEHLLFDPEQTLFRSEEEKVITPRATDGLSHYMRSMGGHKQLTREDEYELSRRAKKGDESARRTLAVSNLPFVVAVAKKFASRGARLDDLIQEGNVGLMKAIEHFDPKKKSPNLYLLEGQIAGMDEAFVPHIAEGINDRAQLSAASARLNALIRSSTRLTH